MEKLTEEFGTAIDEAELILMQSAWDLKEARNFVKKKYQFPQTFILDLSKFTCPVCYE